MAQGAVDTTAVAPAPTRGERIRAGILGPLSALGSRDFGQTPLGQKILTYQASVVNQIKGHQQNIDMLRQRLSLAHQGFDQNGSPFTDPQAQAQRIQEYTDQLQAEEAAFTKLAGVTPEIKKGLGMRQRAIDMFSQMIHKHRAGQAKGGASGPASGTPPNQSGAGAGTTPGAPPPPPGMQRPGMASEMALAPDVDAKSLPGALALERARTKGKIEEEQAKSPTTPFSSWQDSFEAEHGRRPTTAEIDKHQAENAPTRPGASKPLGPERAENLNQALATLAGGKLPPYLTLGPDSTQKDYDNAKAALKEMRVNALKEKPVDISDDAVDAFADIVMKGGTLPNLGLGGVNARIKIINRVGQIAAGKGKPSRGTGNQIVESKAALSALTRELGTLQTQRGAVGQFEATALKNLDLFEKTAEAVVDKGSPWVNKPLREVEVGALGSDEVVAYNTARQVALTEIARILSSPNMTGVLTNEQRVEVQGLIGPGATLSNVLAASKILKQDMANRKDSLDDEISAVRGQIEGGSGKAARPGNAPPPPSGGTTKFTDNGKTYNIPNDQVNAFKQDHPNAR